MNNRDRFRHVLRFERVDRLPRTEWAIWWDLTLSRWKKEGLRQDIPEGRPGMVRVMEFFGLDPLYNFHFRPLRCTFPAMLHGHGPVTDTKSYEAIYPHLFPEVDWDQVFPIWVRERHTAGELVVWFVVDGFFWSPRTLFGIERHFYAFHDEPTLMKRMNEDQLDYIKKLLVGIANIMEPEFMTFAEDMSYNQGPMLSKQLFDEFMAPYYREVVPLIKAMNIVPFVDSDGNVEKCVPWFKECGIKGTLPLERRAGVDIVRLRQAYPTLQVVGGFDKFTMTKGREAMRAEWERLLPVLRQGGYIPGVDHQTPPEVSISQYRDYLDLLWEYTERAVSSV